MLTPVEIDYWTSHVRGPSAAKTVAYAHAQAMAWVDSHAGHMLPSIQHGIVRNYFRFVIETDGGERRLLMDAIDALLQMGEAIHANSNA
ncbi:hypothetical protein [Luteimonas changyuni]|uniref:hypothetical protein n=1 Tax=Luteimonas sp. MJ145 TaxID=3129234 RepID=UPI0031BA362C